MLLDFNQSDPGDLIQADVCIIGGGMAGITLAREFADSRHTVIVLESGGLAFDQEVQNLYDGINVRGDFSLRRSRFRLLGGTSYVWGGWCAPLDDIDFIRRDWVPHSGWPIDKEDLLPYYRRAQPVCELGRYRYDISEWPTLAAQSVALDPDKLTHRLWQLSPQTLFGEVYLEQLRKALNVQVILNATATEIVTDLNGSVGSEVRIANLGGRASRVKARVYVLACGGIETPRLMLASNRVEPHGLGNRNDLVGRFFMEHPHPDAGGVFLSGDIESFRPYFDTNAGKGEEVVLGFGPSPRAQ